MEFEHQLVDTPEHSSVRADDLAATVLSGLIKKNPNIDPLEIDEVIFGCANQAGEDNRNAARMATLLAGLPHLSSCHYN